MFVSILSSWALAAVPEGYETWDGLKAQFTIGLPAGWSAYDQTRALSGGVGPHGVVLFSAQPVTKEGEKLADPGLMSRVDSGEVAAFFVDRQPSAKGMSCAKFSKSAAYDVGVRLAKDPIFGTMRSTFGAGVPLKHDEIQVGGCQGFRFKGEGKKGEWILDVRAVSDGKVLYLFSLRNTAANYGKNIDTFDKAIGTLELARRE